jgi:hypothetical protein
MARDSYLPMIPLGEVMRAFGVGEVIETRLPEFKRGDLVQGMFGWQDYVATDAQAPGGLRKLAPQVSPNLALSLFGITGPTAYFGMMEIGQIKAGETVVVSGAAGSTPGKIAGGCSRSFGQVLRKQNICRRGPLMPGASWSSRGEAHRHARNADHRSGSYYTRTARGGWDGCYMYGGTGYQDW